ncbi:MAG: PAS domain S-box protein [Promethearchaeota archaeon]
MNMSKPDKSDKSESDTSQELSILQSLLDNLPQSVVRFDKRGGIAYLNKKARNLFTYSNEQIGSVSKKGQFWMFFTIEGNLLTKEENPLQIVLKTHSPVINFRVWAEVPNNPRRMLQISDYPVFDSEGNFEGVNSFIEDITEQYKMQSQLQEADKNIKSIQEQFEIIFERAPVGIALVGMNFQLIKANETYCEILGYTESEVAMLKIPDFTHPEDVEENLRLQALLGEEKIDSYRMEKRIIRKNGEIRYTILMASLIRDKGGIPSIFLGHLLDITEMKQIQQKQQRLEEQLLQAQKIESVGRLVGGIAHDFNNILTVILGDCELTLIDLPPDDSVAQILQGIKKNGERASKLIRQLLHYSRKQFFEPIIVDINMLIMKTDKMLRRLIGSNIELVTILEPNIGYIKIDPSQFEQVLANLSVNARDAMPTGGKLTIRTGQCTVGENNKFEFPDGVVGEYITLFVEDTGSGMDEWVLSRLFEPYFTTKELGKGTGLGLSTCSGIIKKHGGFIRVSSQLGHGTIFTVYIPVSNETPQSTILVKSPILTLEGKETLLVVEDEPNVLDLIVKITKNKGYCIYQASNGEEAIRLANSLPKSVDLVITDLMMPIMGGKELAIKFNERHPSSKILFMSGYTDDMGMITDIAEKSLPFLQKPFTPHDLLQKIRLVLDS